MHLRGSEPRVYDDPITASGVVVAMQPRPGMEKYATELPRGARRIAVRTEIAVAPEILSPAKLSPASGLGGSTDGRAF